ncbi:MAG: DUF3800 domain-containing protein [Anaerolineae bacterium]
MTALYCAFLDESGGVAIFASGEPFLVVAALVIHSPRHLDLIIKRALKRFGASLGSGEMKAAHSSEKTIRWILEAIAAQDVAIITVVVDKRGLVKPPKDPEELYRQAVARVIRLCIERWPRLEAILDKRYTHEYLRQKLEWYIREEIANIPGQVVVIRQEESARVKALQAADYVAWAIRQKYQAEGRSYYQLIRNRVVAEEIIEAK